MASSFDQLTDGIIELRPLSLDDAEEHLAGEDEEAVRWLGDGEWSELHHVTTWIERNMANRAQPVPMQHNFGIWDVVTGSLAGNVDANIAPEIDDGASGLDGIAPGEANVSYTVFPAFRGRAYAARAVDLICEFIAERGVPAAVIRALSENRPSIRVAERSGFEHVGEVRSRDEHLFQCYRRQLNQST